MNWEAIGAVGEILGTLAVVISLGYVAVQIRQNTSETKMQRTQSLISANSEVNLAFASNGELAKILRLGLHDYNQLSEDEQVRCGGLCFSAFNRYGFAYHQFRTGQLEEKFWNSIEYELSVFLSLPGGSEWWNKDKPRFLPEFVTHIDRMLKDFAMPDAVPSFAVQTEKNAD